MRVARFEIWLQRPMLLKIHLSPLLSHPLHMTGVVEKTADPGSIAMMEAIDGSRVLGNIPEVGVVQT